MTSTEDIVLFPNAVDQSKPIPDEYTFPMVPSYDIMKKFANENFKPIIVETRKEKEDEYIESQSFKKPLRALFTSIPDAFFLTTEQIIDLMQEKYQKLYINQGIHDLHKHRESFDNVYYEILNDCRLRNMIPIKKEEALANGFIIKDDKENLRVFAQVHKEFIKQKVINGSRKPKKNIKSTTKITKPVTLEEELASKERLEAIAAECSHKEKTIVRESKEILDLVANPEREEETIKLGTIDGLSRHVKVEDLAVDAMEEVNSMKCATEEVRLKAEDPMEQ